MEIFTSPNHGFTSQNLKIALLCNNSCKLKIEVNGMQYSQGVTTEKLLKKRINLLINTNTPQHPRLRKIFYEICTKKN